MTAETFYSKLKQMQDDLHSIVTRMVADHSYDTAKLAMEAARAVGMLADAVDNTIGRRAAMGLAADGRRQWLMRRA